MHCQHLCVHVRPDEVGHDHVCTLVIMCIPRSCDCSVSVRRWMLAVVPYTLVKLAICCCLFFLLRLLQYSPWTELTFRPCFLYNLPLRSNACCQNLWKVATRVHKLWKPLGYYSAVLVWLQKI